MVGRPREFDADAALDRVRLLFWQRGFAATSLADVMEATGLQKGSIYKAFGDKRSLFLRALTGYLHEVRRGMTRALDDAGPADAALLALLETVIDMGGPNSDGRGCLAVNTLVELGREDQDVAALLDAHFQSMSRSLAAALRRGQREDTIRTDLPADDLADVVGTFIAGLSAALSGGVSAPEARRRARALLRTLRAP